MNDYQNNESYSWLYILEIVLGTISCTACSITIIIFFIRKDIRTFAFELILYLSIACLGSTISYLIIYINDDDDIIGINMPICLGQAFSMLLFESSQILFATLISYYIYKEIKPYKSRDDISTFTRRIIYLSIGFGIPLTVCIIALSLDLLGPSGKYCWINTINPSLGAKIYELLDHFFIWCLIATNFIIAIKVKRLSLSENDSEFVKTLIVYPIISMISWLPATINRILLFFDVKIAAFSVIYIILNHLEGIAYIFASSYNSKKFKNTILKLCKKKCYKKKGVYPLDISDINSNKSKILEESSESF